VSKLVYARANASDKLKSARDVDMQTLTSRVRQLQQALIEAAFDRFRAAHGELLKHIPTMFEPDQPAGDLVETTRALTAASNFAYLPKVQLGKLLGKELADEVDALFGTVGKFLNDLNGALPWLDRASRHEVQPPITNEIVHLLSALHAEKTAVVVTKVVEVVASTSGAAVTSPAPLVVLFGFDDLVSHLSLLQRVKDKVINVSQQFAARQLTTACAGMSSFVTQCVDCNFDAKALLAEDIVGKGFPDDADFDFRRVSKTFFTLGGDRPPVTVTLNSVSVDAAAVGLACQLFPAAKFAAQFEAMVKDANGTTMLKTVLAMRAQKKVMPHKMETFEQFSNMMAKSAAKAFVQMAASLNDFCGRPLFPRLEIVSNEIFQRAQLGIIAMVKIIIAEQTSAFAQLYQVSAHKNLHGLVDDLDPTILIDPKVQEQTLEILNQIQASELYCIFHGLKAIAEQTRAFTASLSLLSESSCPTTSKEMAELIKTAATIFDEEAETDNYAKVASDLAKMTALQALMRELSPGESRQKMCRKAVTGLTKPAKDGPAITIPDGILKLLKQTAGIVIAC
jgi:hypothetical protein